MNQFSIQSDVGPVTAFIKSDLSFNMATSNPQYARSTRSTMSDPIFGAYLDRLPMSRLPTMTEIYRNFLHRKESEFHLIYSRGDKVVKSLDQNTKNKIIKEMAIDLKAIWWTEASIPVKDDGHIREDIRKLVEAGAKLSKDTSQAKKLGNEEFLKRKGFSTILDISKCRYLSILLKKVI